MTYPRGSEWRRWDLHVHSPESAFENRFTGTTIEEKWNNYIKHLETLSDIAAIGITDYFSIEGYLKAKKIKDSGRLANIDLLLPNLELRLDTTTERGLSINIHVLFNPKVADDIENCILTNLKFSYDGKVYNCTKSNIISLGKAFLEKDIIEDHVAFRAGAEQFKVNRNELEQVLKQDSRFHGNYLIGIPNSSTDGNSGNREGNQRAVRAERYRQADFIFSSNFKDREYFLSASSTNGVKPCFHGSDAHALNEICKPNLERFNWIKADPTFEGLKQTLFEPDDRVRIAPESPALEYPKSYFSSISMSGVIFENEKTSFSNATIPLNENLVAIIGGRGTGKSLLLDVMYKIFHETEKQKNNNRLSLIGTPEFSISLTKSDGEVLDCSRSDSCNEVFPLDYLHVRQSEVKEVAENKNELARAIKQLLGFEKNDSYLVLNQSLSHLNKEQCSIYEKFKEKNQEDEFIYSEEIQNKRKKQLQSLIETLTTKDIQNKIIEFSGNSSLIGKLAKAKNSADELVHSITQAQYDLNQKIHTLNNQTLGLEIAVQEIDLSTTLSQVTKYIEGIKEESTKRTLNNQRISEQLASKGIKGDVAGLLEKVDKYQREIESCDFIVRTIGLLKENLDMICQKRQELVDKFVATVEEERSSFEKRYSSIRNGQSTMKPEHKELLSELLKHIEINGEVLFNKEKFFQGLRRFFDGRKYRNNALEEVFPIFCFEDYVALIRDEEVLSVATSNKQRLTRFIQDADGFYQQDLCAFFNYLYADEFRSEYLQVVPSLKYLGKEPHQLSVGQRGTFYICLKLATSTFLTPFVFDQPEDDLDNAFIVEELEPIFRKIKKYRQVIIVTHNANLVVNADAEQIIIAKNDNEELSYNAGSLESPEIRTEVCRILEGGEDAFKKREQRYGIK